MEATQYLQIVVVFLSLVTFSRLSFAASKSPGFSIKLIPIDSQESPLYQPNLTQHERIERRVNITLAKAKVTKLRSTQNATFGDDKYLTPIERHYEYYIAQMMIGNPIQYVYLAVDTGSGLIWTQCQPCINCFQQNYPIYDRQASSSFEVLSCDHPSCNYEEEYSIFQCINGICVYSNRYGTDGPLSSGPTRGYFSSESLHFLVSDSGHTEEFTILFGCSNDNVNFEFGSRPDNLISGILGLDLNSISLVGQLDETIGGVFSYCIAPFDEFFPFDVHPHKLRFGDDVHIPQGNIPTTHYLSFQGKNFYYLDPIDISVGSFPLELPPDSFYGNYGGGFFLDSGTPMTMLRTSVFQLVTSTFRLYYDSCLVRIPTTTTTMFDVCYMQNPNFRDYLSLTFHFRGADYEIHSRFVHVHFNDVGYFCVALLSDPTISALGAYHMQNMRIIHNRQINAVQFYPEECGHDYF